MTRTQSESEQIPMSEASRVMRLGTRGSALARWQTEHVCDLLLRSWPHLRTELVVLTTTGDRALDVSLAAMGGKGAFTAELEQALRAGTIDLAVHSLKDLPTADSAGLVIGAIIERGDPGDLLVTRGGHTLATLPHGARLGTSSRRRAAQLLRQRPDLTILDLRGNVDTRLRKALDPDGPYDGVVLAQAGVERLGLVVEHAERLHDDVMLPAPGQGALAVQCGDDVALRALLEPLNHLPTQLSVTAERAFLAALGGGCATPVAALGTVQGDRLTLRGRVTRPDGGEQMDVSGAGRTAPDAARALGEQLAARVVKQGAPWLADALT
jgi:hydroxymethylbilane synthase